MEDSLKKNFNFPPSFCMENFIRSYVNEALLLARDNPDLDSFDADLRSRLSAKIGISEEVVQALHHPFHWAFFNSENDSIFEYVQAKKQGEKTSVRLRREYGVDDVDNLSSSISHEYGEYLNNKLNHLKAF